MSCEQFMQLALDEAKTAFAEGEVPIGAILVCKDQVIARAHNTREQDKSPLSHAEMKVLQDGAKQKGDWRLRDCDVYVTLEPCPMCLGALFQARVQRLFIGTFDPKRNAKSDFPGLSELHLVTNGNLKLSSNNHKLEIFSQILEKECADILQNFFRQRRFYDLNKSCQINDCG